VEGGDKLRTGGHRHPLQMVAPMPPPDAEADNDQQHAGQPDGGEKMNGVSLR
jgi:hypothetical protein